MDASNTQRPTRSMMVGGMVFLIAIALSGFLTWQLEQKALHDERVRVSGLASNHAHAIEYTIEHALTAAHALAALVRQGNGSVPNFDAIASKILPSYPGASQLALAPGGVIRNITPMPGNEMALGLDLLTDPAQRKESLLARDSEKITLAGRLSWCKAERVWSGACRCFLKTAGATCFSGGSRLS